MRQISKALYATTSYRLMSARLISPEKFHHPIGSEENRKEIFLSLTPMLNAAETQRKIDAEECEKFTRCRCNRTKGKTSYQYIDIDTTEIVDYKEYEKR